MTDEEKQQSLGERVLELGRQLALIEEKLLTRDHKPEDLVRHMQLIQELRSL